MRNSLYWDDFQRRILETVDCIRENKPTPVRRVAIFITNKCNFRCAYCNGKFGKDQMTEETFDGIVKKYGNTAILHITGGEPSTVNWLYPYIERTPNVRFHLNTNAFITPPKNVKRLKISLDSHNEKYFNKLVNKNAFSNVIAHIKSACKYTTVSITCVLSKETYRSAPSFMAYCRKEFPKLYAVFFSIYKGDNKRFILEPSDADVFFNEVKPRLEMEMDDESLNLFNETADKKLRIIQGVRFPENSIDKLCYISLSERTINWDGTETFCSHLFRDGILKQDNKKLPQCQYGCNRRLVKFNQEVENILK